MNRCYVLEVMSERSSNIGYVCAHVCVCDLVSPFNTDRFSESVALSRSSGRGPRRSGPHGSHHCFFITAAWAPEVRLFYFSPPSGWLISCSFPVYLALWITSSMGLTNTIQLHSCEWYPLSQKVASRVTMVTPTRSHGYGRLHGLNLPDMTMTTEIQLDVCVNQTL